MIENQPRSGGTLETMTMMFRPSRAPLIVSLTNPMAYAMGYRSIAALRLPA
jgi:hypothetical protein